MKKTVLFSLLSTISLFVMAGDYHYKFRLILKDKANSGYSIDNPKEFLSERAIERRKRQKIAIDSTDFPVSKDYIQRIERLGAKVVAKSKWQNTITVDCADSLMVSDFLQQPFVVNAAFVWKGKEGNVSQKNDTVLTYPAMETIAFGDDYGRSLDNIKLNNGLYLHQAGYKGKGMEIAVIDAGFNNLPKIEMLDNVHIKGTKGFVYGNENLFSNSNQHGLNVLSCIATNKPMQFLGSAPEASFWLLGSEDSRSEFPVEEDYWTAAIEYADSVGVDVVNTSLGYNSFDKPAKSFEYADVDGKTAFITRSANKATQKGMFVVISGGNSGNSKWRKITPPSDAYNVLTVGAVQRDSIVTSFSSRGMTADLRIKPDVMALGDQAYVVGETGLVEMKSGTSFSSPILAGLVACLWQAYPDLTNRELLWVMRESANRYDDPDEDYGYGIPDMQKAMLLAEKVIKHKNTVKSKK